MSLATRFLLFPLIGAQVIPRRHLSTSNDPPLRSKAVVTFIPVVLSKVDYPFRSSGRFKELARKFHRLLSRGDFLCIEKRLPIYVLNVIKKRRISRRIRGSKATEFQGSKTQKPASQKGFSRQTTSTRLMSFRHTIARTLLMHAISDVREKYGTRATYR